MVRAAIDTTSTGGQPTRAARVTLDVISRWGSVLDETPEELRRRVMQVNVETMFLVAKHAIPAMIEAGGGGAIVNVSSISALRPRGLTVYSASKGAVIALTRAMAVDHGPQTASASTAWRPGPGPHPADGLPGGHEAERPPGSGGGRRPSSASRGRDGTSVTPCASSSRTMRATSPATRWSWTVARAWSVLPARPVHDAFRRRPGFPTDLIHLIITQKKQAICLKTNTLLPSAMELISIYHAFAAIMRTPFPSLAGRFGAVDRQIAD